MQTEDFINWIDGIITGALAVHGVGLTPEGRAHLRAGWLGPASTLAEHEAAAQIFEREQTTMARFLALSAGYMIDAASSGAILANERATVVEVGPDAVERGTRGLLEIKCATWLCDPNGFAWPLLVDTTEADAAGIRAES